MKNIAALSLLLINGSALAGVTGFAWSDCYNASCTPSALYQFNSSGAVNEVNRLSPGSYEVRMPGIASSGGHAQVTAYNTNGHCQIEFWYANGNDEHINVACFDAAGTRADALFDVLFFDHGPWTTTSRREAAYAWSDLLAPPANHQPSASYRHTSTVGNTKINKVYTGTYDVFIPHMRVRSVVPVVSSYGAVPARCGALDWYGQGSGINVRVECTSSTGLLQDSLFTVAVVGGAPGGADTGADYQGAGIAVDAFGVVDTFSSFYNIPGLHSNAVSASRLGVGLFEVTLPALADLYDTFIVTTQPSAIGTRCNMGGWGNTGIDTVASVQCYNGAGAPADAAFILLWQTSSP